MLQLTRFSLTHPWITIAALAVVTVVLGAGLTRVKTEFGYRVLVGSDHPSMRVADEFVEQFGGGLPLVIAWECGNGAPCESAFDTASLRMADDLARKLAPIAGVQRVEGVASSALLVPNASGFAVRRFYENGQPAVDIEALAARALIDPFWVHQLVSADATVGAVVLQPVDTENSTSERLVEAIDLTLAPWKEQGFGFYLSGDAIATVVSGRELARSSSLLIPFTVLVVAAVLFFLSRSAWAVAIALFTMGLGLLWTFGLLGWLGWPRDGILEVLAPLILLVGVCDAVHLLARYGETNGQADGAQGRNEALLAVASDIGRPCLVTSLTTAGALLSFVTSGLDTFVRFGAISAFGVMCCLVLTFTCLPLLCLRVGTSVRARRVAVSWQRGLDALVGIGTGSASAVLFVSGVGACAGAVGLTMLTVDTDWHETFGRQSRVIRWIRFIDERLSPIGSLEVEIRLPDGVTAEEPHVLRAVDDLSSFLSEVEGLGLTTSVVDLVSWANRLLNEDDPQFEQPAPTMGANAELLELVEFESPALVRSWVTLDRSRLRVSAETPDRSHEVRRRIRGLVESYLHAELPANWGWRLTGQLAMNFDWMQDVRETQLRSFPVAFAIVFVMVAVFLRSMRLALLAMVPTVLPVIVVLGMMGWLGMSLDIGRAMIAAVVIGVSVDDSIHLLSQYQKRRAKGSDREMAIKGAVTHTGRAVVTTSLALSLGFLTLLVSAWRTVSTFGFCVSVAIFVALVATLLVLPALVITYERAPEGKLSLGTRSRSEGLRDDTDSNASGQ